MRGDETAYPCGRKPVPGSLETTQCVRHQLFDARVKAAVADRLATAADEAYAAMDDPSNDFNDTGDGRLMERLRAAIDEYRKAVS